MRRHQFPIAVLVSAMALLALAPASPEALTAALAAERGEVLVSRVAYEGNKRTKASALDELTGLKAGMRLSEIDPEALRLRILDSGIFSSASLSADILGGDAVVTVTVEEKWTLIPIPSASFGSGGWSAGLAVLDYNFLGFRKSIVASGSYSNLGPSATLAYSDPRFLGSKASLGAFVSTARESKEACYMDGASYADYVELTADGGLSFCYPSEAKLGAELDLTLRYSGVSAKAAASYGLREDCLSLIPALSVNYNGRSTVGYRKAGPVASVTYTQGIGLGGADSYELASASAQMDFGIFLGGFLEAGFAGRWGTRPFQAQGSLSGCGYRTLPQGESFSSGDIAAYANLAIPFWKPGWGAMEIGPFYEGGVYATGLYGKRIEAFHGPGLGFRLYLRDIALPAIEIFGAYNVPAANPVFGLNIGLSM